MAVGISSLKFSAEETAEALFTLDAYVLDEETLHKLLRICPTQEEQKLLNDNSHRMQLLTQQEQYIYTLMQVPRLSNRVECLLFKQSFDTQFVEYNKTLEQLFQAYEAVANNEHLLTVLAILLKAGNYLNQGAKPVVTSFNLDYLLKLPLMKGVGESSKQTMLEWLVLELINKEALHFAIKLDKCEAASKIEMT